MSSKMIKSYIPHVMGIKKEIVEVIKIVDLNQSNF